MAIPLALAALPLGVLTACAGEGEARSERVGPVRQTLQVQDVVSPAVHGARNGLELMGWIVADVNEGLVEQALAPFADASTPMPPEIRQRWRRSGLRFFRVPLDELGPLRERLPLLGRAERRWFGQATEWTTVFDGGFVDPGNYLWIDRGPVRLESGRLRMLTRAFTIPEAGGPTLWTEVAIELAEDEGSNPFRRPSLRRPERAGLVFRGLTAEMPLSPGYAYLVFEASPDAAFEAEEEVVGERPAGDAPPADASPAGPLPPRLPMLGERLMRARSGENVVRSAYGEDATVRRLIAFVPRLPTRYTLLP